MSEPTNSWEALADRDAAYDAERDRLTRQLAITRKALETIQDECGSIASATECASSALEEMDRENGKP